MLFNCLGLACHTVLQVFFQCVWVIILLFFPAVFSFYFLFFFNKQVANNKNILWLLFPPLCGILTPSSNVISQRLPFVHFPSPPYPNGCSLLLVRWVQFCSCGILAHGMIEGPEKLTGNACSWSALCGISLLPGSLPLHYKWLVVNSAACLWGSWAVSIKQAQYNQSKYLSLCIAMAGDKGSEQVKGRVPCSAGWPSACRLLSAGLLYAYK